MKNCIEYADWLKFAEDNDLLLTPASYAKLVKGKKYKMVKIDYMNFLMLENFFKHGKPYDPLKAYTKGDCIYVISPTKVITKKVDHVVERCCNCEGIHDQERTVTKYGLKSPTMGWDFYTVDNGKWLTTGNGDSLSRWMLLDDLKKMPCFYYIKD